MGSSLAFFLCPDLWIAQVSGQDCHSLFEHLVTLRSSGFSDTPIQGRLLLSVIDVIFKLMTLVVGEKCKRYDLEIGKSCLSPGKDDVKLSKENEEKVFLK